MTNTSDPRLVKLFQDTGQSPWLDNLRRGFITSGELASYVKCGVRGLTSNPTIFQKAIQDSEEYDTQFQQLQSDGYSVIDSYWEMVIEDITGALSIFEDLYQASGGTDGFVSVEVDPTLARDTAETLIAARALDQRISRPNVMIKIPATTQGIPAIKEMVGEGRNVNVTLIFSLARYEEVVIAYIEGLEIYLKRTGADLSKVAGVASFFISRVDSEVDAQLLAIGTSEAAALQGKAAIAQAKLAYQIFQKSFSGPRWDALAVAGGQPQRPLWASTSTKNPSFRDTLYVDELIGPSSVNTLPDATLEAFDHHGTVARTIDRHIDEAHEVWRDLATLGIDMAKVADKLENEGVASFQKSFKDLLTALTHKAEKLR